MSLGRPCAGPTLASEIERSLRQARLEAERRWLERERRAALALLGARAWRLVAEGALPAAPLAAELDGVARSRERCVETGRSIEALTAPPSGAADGEGTGTAA